MARLVYALLLAALAGAGCGTTNIVTNDPRARIYADGRLVGMGQGEVDQRGTPGSMKVLVKAEDGRREETTVKRRFTATTFFGGLLTYGVCFIVCWEYPDNVFLALPLPAYQAPAGAAQASWDSLGGPGGAPDPWLQAPPGWRPRTVPASAPAAPAAPAPP